MARDEGEIVGFTLEAAMAIVEKYPELALENQYGELMYFDPLFDGLTVYSESDSGDANNTIWHEKLV